MSSKKGTQKDSSDSEMEKVLQNLLARNENITARAVARHHPTIKAASSIIRSQSRAKLLAQYQARQKEYQKWQGNLLRISKEKAAAALAEKDCRIAELERKIQILTASHVAMIRAVGEVGGFARWANFFNKYNSIRKDLELLGALNDKAKE